MHLSSKHTTTKNAICTHAHTLESHTPIRFLKLGCTIPRARLSVQSALVLSCVFLLCSIFARRHSKIPTRKAILLSSLSYFFSLTVCVHIIQRERGTALIQTRLYTLKSDGCRSATSTMDKLNVCVCVWGRGGGSKSNQMVENIYIAINRWLKKKIYASYIPNKVE